MKRWHKWLLAVVILVAFGLSPLFAFVKSITVMSIYSASEHSKSIIKEMDMDIDIPGGFSTLKKDWYPFVMTFNPSASSFSRQLGRDAEISILYNFGAFEYYKGSSTYYNDESDYFGGFYGAYVIKDEQQPFGFYTDGQLNPEELSIVPSYDLRILVLKSIGMTKPKFEHDIVEIKSVEHFLGFDDWVMMDSKLYTNSPMHKVDGDYMAYIQYGKPYKGDYDGEDFPEIELYGRVYARYFPEQKATVCFYVIADGLEVVNETDLHFIQKSTLTFKE